MYKRQIVGNRWGTGENFCLNCETKIENRATYCSNACQHEHKREQNVLSGKAGHRPVKKYLLSKKANCDECGIGEEWNGKPLGLELDHVNGDSKNNTLKNVRLLCPNCHSQTDTYKFKNAGNSSRTRKVQYY